jgi:hypothetical protein
MSMGASNAAVARADNAAEVKKGDRVEDIHEVQEVNSKDAGEEEVFGASCVRTTSIPGRIAAEISMSSYMAAKKRGSILNESLFGEFEVRGDGTALHLLTLHSICRYQYTFFVHIPTTQHSF